MISLINARDVTRKHQQVPISFQLNSLNPQTIYFIMLCSSSSTIVGYMVYCLKTGRTLSLFPFTRVVKKTLQKIIGQLALPVSSSEFLKECCTNVTLI